MDLPLKPAQAGRVRDNEVLTVMETTHCTSSYLQAQWAEALTLESELLHKQLAILEHELQTAKQATKQNEEASPAPVQPSTAHSDLNTDQQLRILMTCANTAERRVKQLEEELERVGHLS